MITTLITNTGNGFYYQNDSENKLLFEACQKGEVKQVEELLRVNPQHFYLSDDRERTPIHLAAISGKVELFKYLAYRNLNCLRFRDRDKNTPLHLAAKEGNLEMVQEIIRLGKIQEGLSFLNRKNRNKQTPMMLAASKNHREVVKALLDAGASTSEEDFHERTVFHISAANGYWKLLTYLLNANPEGAQHQDAFHHTPLDLAAASGNIKAISKLLQCGAKVNHIAFDGRTAMHQAARNNRELAMRLLHARGAFLNERERDSGMTPMHEAVFAKNVEAVKCLKEMGANLQVGDKRGDTPIVWARYRHHPEIIDILNS